jgi:hypothetical protein
METNSLLETIRQRILREEQNLRDVYGYEDDELKGVRIVALHTDEGSIHCDEAAKLVDLWRELRDAEKAATEAFFHGRN